MQIAVLVGLNLEDQPAKRFLGVGLARDLRRFSSWVHALDRRDMGGLGRWPPRRPRPAARRCRPGRAAKHRHDMLCSVASRSVLWISDSGTSASRPASTRSIRRCRAKADRATARATRRRCRVVPRGFRQSITSPLCPAVGKVKHLAWLPGRSGRGRPPAGAAARRRAAGRWGGLQFSRLRFLRACRRSRPLRGPSC